jgi:hypothetical protein
MPHRFGFQMSFLADLRQMNRLSFLILEQDKSELWRSLDPKLFPQSHCFDLDRLSLAMLQRLCQIFFLVEFEKTV